MRLGSVVDIFSLYTLVVNTRTVTATIYRSTFPCRAGCLTEAFLKLRHTNQYLNAACLLQFHDNTCSLTGDR